MRERNEAGHWEGRLSSSALSTATAISTLSFFLESKFSKESGSFDRDLIQHQVDCGVAWMVGEQNSDGGWGDTGLNYSNISTSMLVVAALHASGRSKEFAKQIELAEGYIERQGGIAGLKKRYGIDKTFAVPILANCAMAGLVPWKEVSALPFEAACVPQRFYNLMQLPVVSYAIPALVAIGQAKFKFDPPWDPIRKTIRRMSIGKSLRVLEKMQPASGGFLEAVPLTSFVSMALVKCGKADHPVVQSGIRFILESFRYEEASSETRTTSQAGNGSQSRDESQFGSWPIDTNLATWNTTLAANALANHPSEFSETIDRETGKWNDCLDWILSCQNTTVHPFTGAEPGGWGWSDLTGAVPDADDTPGALLALRKFYDCGKFDEPQKKKIKAAVNLGLGWLINLQNRDKGWPTFCRGWGRLPFDRSGADITAHAIRGLLAWRNDFPDLNLKQSIESGFGYISRHQEKDGSWLPLWFGNQDQPDDINPCYGTAKVLMAYREAKSFDTNEAQFGLNWIVEHQNPDGGWGGGASVVWNDDRLGSSSVEETALCTEILIDHDHPDSQAAARRGIEWLMLVAESNQVGQFSPIGFYFAKLWYYEKMYPLIFATSALGRMLHIQCSRHGAKK